MTEYYIKLTYSWAIMNDFDRYENAYGREMPTILVTDEFIRLISDDTFRKAISNMMVVKYSSSPYSKKIIINPGFYSKIIEKILEDIYSTVVNFKRNQRTVTDENIHVDSRGILVVDESSDMTDLDSANLLMGDSDFYSFLMRIFNFSTRMDHALNNGSICHDKEWRNEVVKHWKSLVIRNGNSLDVVDYINDNTFDFKVYPNNYRTNASPEKIDFDNFKDRYEVVSINDNELLYDSQRHILIHSNKVDIEYNIDLVNSISINDYEVMTDSIMLSDPNETLAYNVEHDIQIIYMGNDYIKLVQGDHSPKYLKIVDYPSRKPELAKFIDHEDNEYTFISFLEPEFNIDSIPEGFDIEPLDDNPLKETEYGRNIIIEENETAENSDHDPMEFYDDAYNELDMPSNVKFENMTDCNSRPSGMYLTDSSNPIIKLVERPFSSTDTNEFKEMVLYTYKEMVLLFPDRNYTLVLK